MAFYRSLSQYLHLRSQFKQAFGRSKQYQTSRPLFNESRTAPSRKRFRRCYIAVDLPRFVGLMSSLGLEIHLAFETVIENAVSFC